MGHASLGQSGGQPPIDRPELHAQIRALARRLDVVKRLSAYGAALQYLESQKPNQRYWILELDPVARTLRHALASP